MERSQRINEVLVHLFNDALHLEEDSLRAAGITELTMREVHTIAAVCSAGENNTMSELAASLSVTVGSLTVAMNTLERKGYVTRLRSSSDKRRVHIHPTEKALAAEEKHRAYHLQMTHAMLAAVPSEQLDSVLAGLEATWQYFQKAIKEEQA